MRFSVCFRVASDSYSSLNVALLLTEEAMDRFEMLANNFFLRFDLFFQRFDFAL